MNLISLFPATNDSIITYVLIGIAAVCLLAAATLIFLKLRQKRK